MELIVLALVGIAGPFIGAYVSGRVTSRIATEQAQRGRRVELYTDLLPAVLPALERGEGTNEEVRQVVERVVREAAATSSEDRSRARVALGDVTMAEQAQERYKLANSLWQVQGTELRRNQMDEAESERKQAIRSAGVHLREYHDWLDKVLG